MSDEEAQDRSLTRRRLLEVATLVPASLVLAQCGSDSHPGGSIAAPSSGAARGLTPTPSCVDGHETMAETEGPYFTPGSPRRASLLAPGVHGTPLVVTGRVLGTDCRPQPNALLDVWQADGNGVYDNRGYRLRGHQFTDALGRYRLTTVVPGLYPGRTRHIHVKVQRRGGPVLTTQLYFPGEPRNDTDPIYDPSLRMRVFHLAGGRRGAFDFVVV